MTLPVKAKKLKDNVPDPVYSTDGSAGLDLTAISESFPSPGIVEYGTGLAFEIPEGYVGLIFPRSSITTKTTLSLGNCVGVIDSDFRGEIKAQFRTITSIGAKKYKVGDRIMQMIIVPFPKVKLEFVENLSETGRGDGGFGSTDTKGG